MTFRQYLEAITGIYPPGYASIANYPRGYSNLSNIYIDISSKTKVDILSLRAAKKKIEAKCFDSRS